MIRTGTLVFSRTALLATLVGWAHVALAQSSTQNSQTGGEWEAQSTAERRPSYQRADSSAGTWKPTRNEQAQPDDDATAPSSKSKTWLAPTQTTGQPKVPATKVAKKVNSNQSTARAPRPFVPPTDATQLSAGEQPASKQAKSAATASAKNRPYASANSSAAQASQSAAHSTNNSAQSAKATPRTPRDRVAYRPRPTPPKPNQLFDDNWIRPLKQVAYQAGQPEELYAPPGTDSEMAMPSGAGGPMTGPGMQSDGEWIGSPDGGCGPDCDGGPMCGDGVGCCSTCANNDGLDLCTLGPHDDESCDTIRVRFPKFQELMVFGGVHGFKGPLDQNRDSGNFGFQEGFNVGAKIPFCEWGYQLGYQSTQSQLSGDAGAGIADAFSQHFVTAGVFRRTRDGFQGGIVWDGMKDERSSTVDFSQVRAEVGFVDCGCHEIGATAAIHLSDDRFVDARTQVLTTFEPVDQYLLYYRMHGATGGEGRVYGGISNDSDGIIGADFLLPLTDTWSLQPAFTYLIPGNSSSNGIASRDEAWNIGINLVWHWRGHARECHSSPYRPLFNVADNGYMIIDNR